MSDKYSIDDYIGNKVNYFDVIGTSEELNSRGEKQWLFRCICGKIVSESPSRVLSGHKKSCGCMRYKTPQQKNKKKSVRPPTKVNPIDYIGRKNNRLTVIGCFRPDGKGRTKLECLCDCGKRTYVYPYQFDSGDIQSCGCSRFGHSDCHKGNTSRKTHGLTKNRFYKKWNDMVRRCYNPNEPAYKFYGELGITVCEEWRTSPKEFIKWCELTHPDGSNLTLDRIDGTKGYSPENCRWATQKEQMRNLKNNRFVEINGEIRCVTEWCKTYGISAGSVYKRVHKGQSFEQAISELISRKSAPVD